MKNKILSILTVLIISGLALTACANSDESTRNEVKKQVLRDVGMYIGRSDQNALTSDDQEAFSTLIRINVQNLKSGNIDDPNIEKYSKLAELIEKNEYNEVKTIFEELKKEE